MLLNTMENFSDGMTYYDLKQFGNIPHSKIYRIMKKLEELGYLRKKELIELGRPKHLYFITDKGLEYGESIREEIRKYLEFIHIRQIHPEYDFEKDLLKATLDIWASPVEFVLNQDISDEEKLEIFHEIKEDLEQMLEKLNNNIRKLKNNENNAGESDEFTENGS